VDIAELELGRYGPALRSAGIRTVEELIALNEREVRALGGIGERAISAIDDALAARGLSLAIDPWDRYRCARDGERTWDTSLETIFLCDECARTFQAGPFDGTEPAHVGDPLNGYCVSCNELRDVRMRQWFLCGVCARVTKSIGRGVVAARYVLGFWREHVQPHAQGITLEETDPPVLRHRTSAAAAPASKPDLTAFAETTGSPVFAIELKSGRSSIGPGGVGAGMGRFQLDQTDCDDIRAAATSVNAVVYLFHVQVIDRAVPPTTRFAAVNLWWTDMFSMREHFQQITQRPRENRPAAYYDVRMFRRAAEFIDHVRAGQPAALTARLRRHGVPELYEV